MLACEGVPRADSTSEGFATARARMSLIASSGVDWVSAARQSEMKLSRFSMNYPPSGAKVGAAPPRCPMHWRSGNLCPPGNRGNGAAPRPLLRRRRRDGHLLPSRGPAAHHAAGAVAPGSRPRRGAGVRLFERSGRRVRMTSAGEGLLLRCRDLLADFQQLAEHAQAMRGGEVGKLSIAASPQVIQSLLAPFVTRYLKSRPGIDVHLVEEGGAHTLGLVERGEVQLALAIRRGNDRLSGRLLFPVRVLAAMPSLHRLARRKIIEVSDLQDERVLLLRQGFGTREMFDGACRIAHVHTRIVLEAGDP